MANQRLAFAARLNEVCDDLGIRAGHGRQADLARMFKVRPQSAQQWLTGTSLPNSQKMRSIALKAGVTLEWLEHGDGPKHRGTAERPAVEDLRRVAEKLPDYKVRQLIQIGSVLFESEDDDDPEGEDDPFLADQKFPQNNGNR